MESTENPLAFNLMCSIDHFGLISEFDTEAEGWNLVSGTNVHFSTLVTDVNGSKCVCRHWDVVTSARLAANNVHSES